MWANFIENSNDPRYIYTLKEILQQPESWKKTAQLVLENKKLEKFLNNAIKDEMKPIIVSGAGSSEFVGQSILATLSKALNRRVLNAPTTDLLTNPNIYSIPNEPSLMISFGRSGNSPESIATVELIKQLHPNTKHLIITCNREGALAKINDDNTFILSLPEETNDLSLVMTSSFSSMIIATVLSTQISNKEQAYENIKKIGHSTNLIYSTIVDKLNKLMQNSQISRIQYLGTSDVKGLGTEAHLKMLEMTDGLIATRIDSFLGLRHGPQVFINETTIVVAILSNDPYIRKYEEDLLNDLKDKNQGLAYIIIGENASQYNIPNLISFDTNELDDFYKLFPAIVICQLLGFFKSLALGLSPDTPSISGTINRVVQGVTIYNYTK